MGKSLSRSLAAAVVLIATGARAADAPSAPPRKTPELVAKGKASYETNCASCHGHRGLGDGVGAAALDPKPRNLVTGKFRNGARPAQVFATLEKGIEGTTMVSYDNLSVEERWALAYYVAELRGAKSAKPAKSRAREARGER